MRVQFGSESLSRFVGIRKFAAILEKLVGFAVGFLAEPDAVHGVLEITLVKQLEVGHIELDAPAVVHAGQQRSEDAGAASVMLQCPAEGNLQAGFTFVDPIFLSQPVESVCNEAVITAGGA